MKTLEPIQKTYNVFKTLAKIAMIVSFLWAGTLLLGVLGGIVWQSGGNIVGVSAEYALKLTQTGAILQMIGVLLGDFVLVLTDGLLFFFALRYFKQELADGTPFTNSGADEVMRLGIKTIVMPIVAIVLAAVIHSCFGVERLGNWDNGTEIVLGIALILFSLILRHGAELREASGK